MFQDNTTNLWLYLQKPGIEFYILEFLMLNIHYLDSQMYGREQKKDSWVELYLN